MTEIKDIWKKNGWKCFWIINFFVQFLLFHSYCVREIVGYIPENMDQVGYIQTTYNIYDLFLGGDIAQALEFALKSGINSGMMLIGAINLFLFGFSRISLLIPNFLALFFAEMAGTRAVRRITQSDKIAFIYYGLILMTKATFAAVGGMFDYRWDFMAFCVYTVWLIWFLEYFYTGEKKYFYGSAFAGGVLLFIRLNMILYLAIILAILMLVSIFKKHSRPSIYLLDWCKYAGVMFLAGGWYVIVNFVPFFNYYFSALFTSTSRTAWQIQMNLKDNLLFYPKLLWNALMGKTQIEIIIMLTVIGIVWIIFKKKSIGLNKNVVLIVILSWAIPYGILTVMDNKNSAAAMILASALILVPVLILNRKEINKYVLTVISGAVIFIGAGSFFLNMISAYPYHTQENAQGWVKANDTIASYMQENDVESAEIIFDKLLYNFFPQTIQVYSREMKGEKIEINYAIPNMKNDYLMSSFSAEELKTGLENTMFLVLNQGEYPNESDFNTDKILRENKEVLKEYAAENMKLIGEVSVEESVLEIYAKPLKERQ